MNNVMPTAYGSALSPKQHPELLTPRVVDETCVRARANQLLGQLNDANDKASRMVGSLNGSGECSDNCEPKTTGIPSILHTLEMCVRLASDLHGRLDSLERGICG